MFLLLGLNFLSQSQILTIKDSTTNKPVESAAIIAQEKAVFLTTNSKGQVDISKLNGALKVTIQAFGYKKVITSYSYLDSLSFIYKLVPSSIITDPVIISASKWSQSSSQVPGKVAVITSKEAALYQPQTTADLLGASGEVFIQKSQQGGGSPIIRGFSANRLLYVVDGVRMNTAIFRGGNLQNVISLDALTIERTEVLFGPGSVIYGSDAIGGVMNFSTLKPQYSYEDKPLLRVNILSRYATANNEKTGHVDINLGYQKWAFVSSFSFSDYDDLKMGKNGPDDYLRTFFVERKDNQDVVIENNNPRIQLPSGYSQGNFMQKIGYKISENWNIEYGLHYSETSSYARYDRLIQLRDGLPRFGEWSYGPQKWMMNQVKVVHDRERVLFDQVNLRAAYQFFEESRISRNLNDAERVIQTEKVDAYSLNVDFNKRWKRKHRFFYGVEFIANDIYSIGIQENILSKNRTGFASRYPNANWSSYAFYFTDQIKISKQLTFQGGFRYNVYQLDATFDTTFISLPFVETSMRNDALTGSFGTVYHVNKSNFISSNISSGFRAPNVDDMGKLFESEPGSVVVPNPDLSAENVYNVDLSFTHKFKKIAKINVTSFYTYLNNALVRRDYTLNGNEKFVIDGDEVNIQAIQNAAFAIVYGFQVAFDTKMFIKGLSFSSKINYQKGREETGNGLISPSRHAAPLFGRTALSWNSSKSGIELYLFYNGTRKFKDMPLGEINKRHLYALDENGNPYSPGWYTLNLKGYYEINKIFTVYSGVENFTNQRYRTYSSGLAAAGINFILSLKASF